MTAASANRAIDLAIQAEPTATVSVDSGVATKWRDISDLVPGKTIVVVAGLFGLRLVTREDDIGTHTQVSCYGYELP